MPNRIVFSLLSLIGTSSHTYSQMEVVMAWEQFLILLITLFGMFYWLKNDSQNMKEEMSADRRDMLTLLRGIQDEMKDFHGRLCTIEERYRNR